MPSHDRRTRTFGLLASIHPRHPIWGKIIWLFDRLWRIIWYIWSVVILGGILVGAAAALLTSSNGTTGLNDPRTWIVIRPLLAHPRRATAGLALALILTLLAYLAHRAWSRYAAEDKNAASEYGLQRVDRLDADAYVPLYVGRVYLPRHEADGGDADARARAALRTAATCADPTALTGPLGISVFGRPTEGKTRLAWEALRAALADWTFVKWPYSRARDFDYASYRGQRVALWLDDLQKYSADEATTLNDLPRRFAAAGARLVVVATCRDDKDETLVRGRHESLLARLTPIRPVDISDAEANQLAAALAKEGVAVRIDQFDRTPGSLLLGVRRMRDERYPALAVDAKHALWALKLLRSARIYEYPGARVRAVAARLFGLNAAYWRDTLNELAGAGFVRLGETGADGERALAPVADAYLDDAVPDYPSPAAANATEADDWPALQRVLTQRRDAYALVELGNAYNQRPMGNLSSNRQHAIECYTAALNDYQRDTAPANWATVQNNMGATLAALARELEGTERRHLLEEAVVTARAALQIRTRAAAPASWAATQNNLANGLSDQADLAEGAERARLLDEAVAAYRAAMEVFTHEAAPVDWAKTQNNLAAALQKQAKLAEGAERTRLLDEAVAACRAALDIRTRATAPADWAQAQYNLANALGNQANLAEGAEGARLLDEAMAAYRAALTVRTREAMPNAYARTQFNLALLHERRAENGDTASAACAALAEARQCAEAALSVFMPETEPLGNRRAIAMLQRIGDTMRALGYDEQG